MIQLFIWILLNEAKKRKENERLKKSIDSISLHKEHGREGGRYAKFQPKKARPDPDIHCIVNNTTMIGPLLLHPYLALIRNCDW